MALIVNLTIEFSPLAAPARSEVIFMRIQIKNPRFRGGCLTHYAPVRATKGLS